MRKAFIWILILASLAGTLACAPQPGQPTSPAISGSPALSNQSLSVTANPAAASSPGLEPNQSTSPTLIPDDLSILVDGNTAFALDLYHQLSQSEGNLFYSPYSISLALAMAYGGARGETAQQMADTLHFNLPDETIHSAFEKLAQELSKRSKTVNVTVKEGDKLTQQPVENLKLNIANAVWGRKNYPFLSPYIDLVKTYYDAEGLRQTDFAGAPEESRQMINNWISRQTQDKIEEMLPPGLIDNETVMLLTNAVYFKAFWQYTFGFTEDEAFRLLDKSEVMVPMMSQQTKEFPYYEDDDCQAIAMPYLGRELSMVVILPREGRFTDFEKSLDKAQLDGIIAGLESTEVLLKFPRFKFESEFNLAGTLLNSGMTDAFSPQNADFSGLTKGKIWMDEVLHQSFISVDEKGTEASAATVVRLTMGAPRFYSEFTASRPFIFLIRDNETGAILFLGRLLKP